MTVRRFSLSRRTDIRRNGIRVVYRSEVSPYFRRSRVTTGETNVLLSSHFRLNIAGGSPPCDVLLESTDRRTPTAVRSMTIKPYRIRAFCNMVRHNIDIIGFGFRVFDAISVLGVRRTTAILRCSGSVSATVFAFDGLKYCASMGKTSRSCRYRGRLPRANGSVSDRTSNRTGRLFTPVANYRSRRFASN